MHKGKLCDNGGLTVWVYEGNESEQICAALAFSSCSFYENLVFFAFFFHRMRKTVCHQDFFFSLFELLIYADDTLAYRDICCLFDLPTC